VRWMLREPSKAPVDNGWRIMSAADSSEYLADSNNWRITDFNDACEIEPALIGIYDLPVGSDLQIVIDEHGTRIVDTPTGRELTPERMYVPPSRRR
ncbi:immunity protein Imm33 domain-containing protein, partial [Rathayibacter rathayi]